MLKKLLITFLVFLTGFGVATVFWERHERQSHNLSDRYPYLARRVLTDNPSNTVINFTDLRAKIKDYITSKGDDSTISVYFEYLPTGTFVRASDNSESVAASLMKIPVVMSLYHLAEQGKVNLDQTVSIKKEWLNDQYGTLYKKGEGYKLTLREASKLALRDSDNTAILAVQDAITKANGDLGDSLNFMDIAFDVNQDGRVLIGARSYSSILKCLYLSCYLKRDQSQELLKYLTESPYKNRLVARLPTDLVVAHKIGSYSTDVQSDCGIFYLEKRNYLLCVMVRRADPEASVTIADISRLVYDSVSSISVKH